MTFNAAESLKLLLGEDIIAGLEVTDEGTLDISWVRGHVFNQSSDIIVPVQANTGTTLTDDDTNYLYWADGAPTVLAVKLTLPTGNEVLVATIICTAGDITSITEHGFDFSSVSGLNGRPAIRLIGDIELPYAKNYGQIIIGQETLIRVVPAAGYRAEHYRIMVQLMLASGVGPALLKAVMAQMDEMFKTNNDLSNYTYLYELLYTWEGLYTLGKITIPITAIKDKVAL